MDVLVGSNEATQCGAGLALNSTYPIHVRSGLLLDGNRALVEASGGAACSLLCDQVVSSLSLLSLSLPPALSLSLSLSFLGLLARPRRGCL